MSATITDDDLPFAAEYAKTGRASCKGCKGNIAKESLRLAVMVQAPTYDGKMPNWYHFACFFGRNRIKTVADIKHFDQLRWDDQEKIKAKMVPMGAGGAQADAAAGDASLNDFTVDSAKSSRSVCRGCEAKIIKGAVRVSKKDYDSANAKRFGPMDRWYHLQCFADQRNELEFFPGGSLIPGFSSLTSEEQGLVKEKLPELKQKATKRPAEKSDEPAKKPKLELQKEEKLLKEQNKLIFEFRDNLQKQLSKKEMILLLEHNEQGIPQGESKLLDRLADCMAFGALTPCPECKEGQLSYGNFGYRCHGNLTEWTKCNYLTKTPTRQAFTVPEDLKSAYPFLGKYKHVARERIFSSVEEKPSVGRNSDQPDGPSKAKFPLNDMKFAVVGKTKLSRTDISKLIANLGGEVVGKIDEKTIAVISVKEEVDKLSSKIKEAKTANVHVVSEEVLDALKSGKVAEAIEKNNICDWGADLSTKIKTMSSTAGNGNSSGSGKSAPSLQKLTIKGGSAVDPDSGN